MGSQASSTQFGHGMRSHFQFDPSYRPLNHGSYGTYPLQVRERLHWCQALSESRPDAFFRQIMPRELDASRAAIAKFLGVNVAECVFIPNATTGVNTVLRSLVFNEGDVIVHFSTIYGGCHKTVEYLKETTKLDNSIIDIVYPIGDDEVLTKFQKRVAELKQEGKCPKVALFDTVGSMPGVRVPWERLVQICREEGVLSLVDGAHGVGHLDLNLADAKPDFFVSNCHK